MNLPSCLLIMVFAFDLSIQSQLKILIQFLFLQVLEFGVDMSHQVLLFKLENLEYQIADVIICLEQKTYKHRIYVLYIMNAQILSLDGTNLIEEIRINPSNYEYAWYFSGFFTTPSKTSVSLYVYQYAYQEVNLIFSNEIQLEFQFNENNLNQIFGGDFKVNQNVLSYYPGIINYLTDGFFIDSDYYFQLITEFSQLTECLCQNSALTNIPDVNIEKQDLYEFLSENTNCQQFVLSGWVKIRGIKQINKEIYFQLFRLSNNFQHPQLAQANLCPFQLFYRISSNNNKIVLTTYSYTFPSLNIDFSNNPFLQTVTLDIDFDIQLWHYILVEKLDSQIQISIIFYEGFKQQKLDINLQVTQFSIVQFKLLYGNIFQNKSNFLTIQIVGLKLMNCPNINQVQIRCHSTCKECDGPTKDDCLSCFEQSKRRYIPEQKICVCEYGTIDQNDECLNYETLAFNLNNEQSYKQSCKYGFFEYDGECLQCPSIINDDVITCLECVLNPKIWSQTLYCQTTLFTDKYGNSAKYLQDSKLYYIFIGNDLEYCPECLLKNPSYDQIESIFQFKKFCSESQSIL